MLVYAPGVTTMTQETYRFAYEEANAELREILAHFEVLQARKEQMEQVVEALKIVLSSEERAEASNEIAGEQIPFIVHQSVEILSGNKSEPMPEPAYEPEPAYAESADPFQRRIDMALRHGLGARESRVMPRGLSGLLSRA